MLIAAVYAAGFAAGFLPLGGLTRRPVSYAWGERISGGNGVSILLWCAVACALVAWFLRSSGTAYLRRQVVFAADVQSDRLIVAGPFRYVRNPLYLGNVFLAVALSLLMSPLGAAIVILGNIAIVVVLAREESSRMAERYGPTYEAFRSAVPAFLPRLTPAFVAGSVSMKPSWTAALLGEGFCLLLGAAILTLALFGASGVAAFWTILIATVSIYSALGWWAGRAKP